MSWNARQERVWWSGSVHGVTDEHAGHHHGEHSDGDTSDRPGVGFAAKVLTVSDGVVAGVREDKSGAALVARLVADGYEVADHRVVSDGRAEVGEALVELAEGFAGLIVTTGGTGFGPRDLTPEGTAVILEREAPGLAEAMRLVNPLGRLSRARAGTRGEALIVNTPGSSAGAVECYGAIADVVPHALSLLRGDRPH
jgi:molybdenum cofactor synthesis domain-containing protein